jgi:hypothetical protein
LCRQRPAASAIRTQDAEDHSDRDSGRRWYMGCRSHAP